MCPLVIHTATLFLLRFFQESNQRHFSQNIINSQRRKGYFELWGTRGVKPVRNLLKKIYSQLLRCRPARRSSTGFSQVGPTKFYWLNYWHTFAE